MKRQLAILASITLILATAEMSPCLAEDALSQSAYWVLTPDSARPHPGEKQIAIAVRNRVAIVTCLLQYQHARYQWDEIDPDGRERLNLKSGGKMTVSLEILKKNESLLIGQQKKKVKSPEERREAWMGWADSSGIDTGDSRYRYETAEGFPIELKSGDVILFSVEFKKMPRLQFERTDSGVLWDELYFDATCDTCGSNGTPCPEF